MHAAPASGAPLPPPDPGPSRPVSRWHRVLWTLCARLYFHRIRVVHAERLSREGPTIFLVLHRNGAVDGFVCAAALPPAKWLIAAGLRRSWLGRCFFAGFEVVRAKDGGDRERNRAALRACRDWVLAGHRLLVFPEGTSTLGPRHLPFLPGATKIIADVLDALPAGAPLAVIPVGIAYEAPTRFRRNVEVVAGEAVPLADCRSAPDAFEAVRQRTESALEAMAVDFGTAEHQRDVERLAYAATLGTRRSYDAALRALAPGIPPPVAASWDALSAGMAARRPFLHQGIPLFPLASAGAYLALWLALAPLVAGGWLLNVVPLAGAWAAGRWLPDGANVVSLWRILVGVPLAAAWALAWVAAPAAAGVPAVTLVWAALTLVALASYYRVVKLSVALGNWLRHRALRPAAHALHHRLQEALAGAAH